MKRTAIDLRTEAEKLEEHIRLIRGLINYHRRSTVCIRAFPDESPELDHATVELDAYDEALSKSLELLEKELLSIGDR